MATYTAVTETVRLAAPPPLAVQFTYVLLAPGGAQPVGIPTTGQIFPRGDRLV